MPRSSERFSTVLSVCLLSTHVALLLRLLLPQADGDGYGSRPQHRRWRSAVAGHVPAAGSANSPFSSLIRGLSFTCCPDSRCAGWRHVLVGLVRRCHGSKRARNAAPTSCLELIGAGMGRTSSLKVDPCTCSPRRFRRRLLPWWSALSTTNPCSSNSSSSRCV